jgi:putative transposase
VTLRSNLRWCSDGLEFVCWNGDVIRAAFIPGAHDREITAWRAVAGAGISGSDEADMMMEAVETRFGGHSAPQSVEMLRPLSRFAGKPLPGGGQRIAIHREGDTGRSLPARLEALLHADQKPAKQWNLGSIRQHAEARLRAGHAAARRRNRARLDRRVDQRLQRKPPALRAENAIATRVHRSQTATA